MNEEALKYSYDLFTKDGYEGTIDQYKALIGSNNEALSHSYKLFRSDGYEGGEEDFKSLVASPPKQEAPKKATAVSTESPSDSAQKAGDSDIAQETNVEEPQPQEQPMAEGGEDVAKQIEYQKKREPNPEIVALYDQYKESGEIRPNDKVAIAQKIADQKEGKRSWWEKAEAYTDGWLRTGMPTPLYKYDTEEGLLEKREQAQKASFLEALPKEKREEINAYAVNRTLALNRTSQNILAENVILEEKSKLLVKNLEHLADAIKRKSEKEAVPQEMIDEFKARKEEIENISSTYNGNIDVIESNNEDIGSFVEELDLLKKNYNGVGYYKDLARLTTADMLSGIMEFGVSTAEVLPYGLNPDVTEQEKFIAEFREETERQRSFLKPVMSIEEVTDTKSFGKWLAEQTMIQLPIITTLAASGGNIGLTILGASSGGSKMGEIKDYQTDLIEKIQAKESEIENMKGDTFIDPEVKLKALNELRILKEKPTYGKSEIYLAGLGNGLAEALSEKVSLGILSKGKRALFTAPKSELKWGYRQYAKESYNLVVGGGIDMTKEASSEFGNNIVQNAIDILYLGNEDVHILDNSLDVIASGGAMGAGMSMFPSLIGMGAKAFMSKDASALMTETSNKLGTLLQELEMGKETLPESTKKLMLDKVNTLIKEQDATLKEAFDRAKKRPKEDNAKLIEIDKEANKIVKQVQDIKAGGLTPSMQAELLKDLKAKRDKLIDQKLEILGKKPMKLKEDETVKEAEEDTTTEEGTTTEDGTTTEGEQGGGTVQGEDGTQPGDTGDGGAVQPDSEGDTGETDGGGVTEDGGATTEGEVKETEVTKREKKKSELLEKESTLKKSVEDLKQRRNEARQKLINLPDDASPEAISKAAKELQDIKDEYTKVSDELADTQFEYEVNEKGLRKSKSVEIKRAIFKRKGDIEYLERKKRALSDEIDALDEVSKEQIDDFNKRFREIDKEIASNNSEIEKLTEQLSEYEDTTTAEDGADETDKGKGKKKGATTEVEGEEAAKRRKVNRQAIAPVTETQARKLKIKAPRVPLAIAKLFERKASLAMLIKAYPKDSPYYPLLEIMAKNIKNFNQISLRWNTAKETREGADGIYLRGSQQISLNEKTRQAEHSIIHEAIHAISVNAIAKILPDSRKIGKEYLDYVQSMVDLAKNSKDPMEKAVGKVGELYLEAIDKSGRRKLAEENANKRLGRGMDMYGFTNLYEFMSEAFSNPKFQEELNRIDSDVADISMYDKLVKAVGKILEALSGGTKIIKDSVLHNLIAISPQVFNANEGISNFEGDLLSKEDMFSVDDSEQSRRERMEEEIDEMIWDGKTDAEIIDSYETLKEKEIAKDILERQKPATKESAKKKLDETFDKAQQEMYEKKGKTHAWGQAMRKLALWFFDRQYVPKMVLKKAGLNLIRNYMITSKGASGYARYMYDEAYKKIYQTARKVAGGTIVYDTLTTADIKLLDKMIMIRRIIAIDKNRAERGLPPVVQTGFLNGAESQLALDAIKDEIGEEKFKDMNKRADEYFKAFKDILDNMVESGLVSEDFREQFFDVDYQPKVYLDFLKTAEQEMSIIEMGAEESSSLAAEQIRTMEEGSAGSLITDSRYLLSRSMNARAKAVSMNNTVSRLVEEMDRQREVIDALKEKDPKDLTAKEKRTIKYFDELSNAVRYNPIVSFTEKGKPKYKYKASSGLKPQYFYMNGVRHQILMEESFFDAFNDNIKGIWKNSNMKEQVSIYSLSGLVKTIATGNNPAFFITNAPRDFMFVATFSPVYGSNVPLNLVKVFLDTMKGIKDITTKDGAYNNFVKYGGMLDYLHKQGEFKGTNWINRKLSTKSGKLFGLIGQKGKDRSVILGNWVSFKRLQMYSEIGIRMGVFNRSVKNQFKAAGVKTEAEFLAKEGELKLQDVYVNATAEARNTTDFSQGGIFAKDADALIPYLNAGIQGTRVAVEQLNRDPFGTTLRIAQSASILSALPLAFGIKMLGWLGDDEVPEDYKGLTASERYLKAREGVSRYDRTNYSIWFTGKFDKDGEAIYFRVAKPHFLTPFITYSESLQLGVVKGNVDDKTSSTALEDVKWALENNISPVEMSVTGTLARNPVFKAALTYTTGYDFYRDQDLSYLRGDVEIPTEGHESKSVEAFYKTLGERYTISPARMKGATESLITTPSTSPFIGLLYGGLDTMLADEDAKEAMKDTKNRLLKSISGRLMKTTSEFNRRINLDNKFTKEISKMEIYDIKNKAKFKDLTKKLMKKEITEDVLIKELTTLAEKNPFDAKRMANIIKSTVENPQVSQTVYQIKFAPAKERALYLVHIFGDTYLEESKVIGKENKKLWLELLTNKAINLETLVEYEKLIGKRPPGDR